MSQPKFKVGQIVQLNSGGPAMTIKSIVDNPIDCEIFYRCQWFDKNTLKEGIFTQDTIQEIDTQPPSFISISSTHEKTGNPNWNACFL